MKNESYNAARQQLTEQEDYHFLLRKSTSGVTENDSAQKTSLFLINPAHNSPGNLRPQSTRQSPPTIHPVSYKISIPLNYSSGWIFNA